MKKVTVAFTLLLVIAAAFLVFRNSLRSRRLIRNFADVRVGMTEQEVAKLLGEAGINQSCTATPKGACDHELAFNLVFPDFLTVEFDRQGRVVEKWRSP